VALLKGERHIRLRDGREAAIRSGRPGDARAVARLLDEIAAEPEVTLLLQPGQFTARDWRQRIEAALDSKSSIFLVATLGDRVVGNLGLLADAHPASPHVRVLGVSVASDVRGLGLGTELIETALRWGARNGATKVTLSVFGDNTAAIAFYERLGFVKEGMRQLQLVRAGRYHDEVLMARFLDRET
jgi:L-phenylalanine/L-methionine N-acetyltransferase